jgi:hypoxanthine phosphoribosyltransferase
MPNSRIEQLVSKQQIHADIQRLAERLCERYSGKTLVVIGLLTGAYVFLTHLTEAMEDWNVRHPKKKRVRFEVGFLGASSYVPNQRGVGMKSSGEVVVSFDIRIPIRRRHVLVVDDVADTLRTLKKITEQLRARCPRTLEVACMVRKVGCAKVRLTVPCYVARRIPNEYVVGMGLDDNGRFRTLPYIGVVRRA